MRLWVSTIKQKFLKFLLFVVLFYLTFLTVRPLFQSGYYPMHDDIQPIRLLEMSKCVADFQIPCRWVPDMGYGFGYPLFNYYAPLPYYLMEVIHLVGFGMLSSIKIYLVLITFVGVLGFYKLASKFWDSSLAGFISALFYLFLPYRAVNLYVRGDLVEYTAQAIIPLILLTSYALIKEKKKNSIVFFALNLGLLLLSHSVSALIFAPFLVGWILYLLYSSRNSSLKYTMLKIALASFGAFALSAFFILPAFLEKGLVHSDTLVTNYFDFHNHFSSLRQILLSTIWGYGSPQAGSNNQIFLGIGLLFWLVPLICLVISLLIKKRRVTLLVLNILSWFGLFMMHPKSQIIWNNISLLKYVQFPWRFNEIAGIFFCLAVGYLAIVLSGRVYKKFVVSMLIVILEIFYGNFFRPSTWLNISDNQKLSGSNFVQQITISINDYLPISTSLSPVRQALDKPEVLTGDVDFISIQKGSDWQNWDVIASQDSTVGAQIFYFPDWKVYVDKLEVPINYQSYNGLITFEIPTGKHNIILKLTDTPIRTISNVLTLLGIPLFVFLYYKFRDED